MKIDFGTFSKPIEDRMRSPLLSSFTISWAICNWEIIYTLITYSNIDIGDNETKGVVAAATSYLSWWPSLVLPLFTALLYTFAYPFAEIFVVDFTSKRKGKQTEVKYKNLSKLNVPGQWLVDSKEINKKNLEIIEGIKKSNEENDIKIQSLTADKIKLEVENGVLEQWKKDNENKILDYNTLSEKLHKGEIEFKDLENSYKDFSIYKENYESNFIENNQYLFNNKWYLKIGVPVIHNYVIQISNEKIIKKDGQPIYFIKLFKYFNKNLTFLLSEVDNTSVINQYFILKLSFIKPEKYSGTLKKLPDNKSISEQNWDVTMVIENSDEYFEELE